LILEVFLSIIELIEGYFRIILSVFNIIINLPSSSLNETASLP